MLDSQGDWKLVRVTEYPSQRSVLISWSEPKGNKKSVRLSESPTYPGYDLTVFNCISFLEVKI